MGLKNKTQRVVNGLFEITPETRKGLEGNAYYNADLAPTKLEEREWNTYHIAALWIGMSVCLPSYSLASGAIGMGMSWWQAVITIGLGNLIVLIPMQLNSHAGTKYGIPYPIFARLSFGIRGAHIAAISRAIIAAGWFGIQCWFGGLATLAMIDALVPADLYNNKIAVAVCYIGFWALNIWIAYGGARAIKFMESWGSPVLIALSASLLIWAFYVGGWSFAPVLAQMPGTLQGGEFWAVFLPQLTANIAFWSTLALNIPDFSRYAKDQKSQFRGQLYGLPTTMAIFAFIGVAASGASQLAYGELLWNPVDLLARMGPVVAILGGVGVVIATLTTNVSANVVAPANGISNINPQKISYKTAVIIAGIFGGFVLMPWYLLSTWGNYFAWLGVYGSALGSLAGLFVADYYLLRQKRIDLDDLFRGPEGRYWYSNGVNWKAVITCVVASILPVLGGALPLVGVAVPGILTTIYGWGWIFSFVIALVIYPLVMGKNSPSLVSEEEEKEMTDFVA